MCVCVWMIRIHASHTHSNIYFWSKCALHASNPQILSGIYCVYCEWNHTTSMETETKESERYAFLDSSFHVSSFGGTKQEQERKRESDQIEKSLIKQKTFRMCVLNVNCVQIFPILSTTTKKIQ